MITEYFSNLFKCEEDGGSLSRGERVETMTQEDNEALLTKVTEVEVKSAVFSMHPDKSPGPDGLNPTFFQVYWNVVGGMWLNFVSVLCKQDIFLL